LEIDRRLRLYLAAHHWAFVALVVAVAALAAILAHEYRFEYDLTRAHRNTLSAATLDLLRRLEGPVRVTAYAASRSERGGHPQRAVREFMRPYQRAKPDLELALVDPRENPKAAAEAAVRSALELHVDYRGRSARATALDEQAFAEALMRVARGTERLVFWLEGHGERRLDGEANHDLGEFGRQLERKGFRLAGLNLALAQEVPDNAALLVIAGPRTELFPGEVEKIKRYLARGGNLLWLLDPEPLRGLEPLAEALGLVLTPGVVVDPRGPQLGGSPAFAVGVRAGYGRHPVTDRLELNTLFPFARQIATIESEDWRITPLIEVAQSGWVETGRLEPAPVFERGRDIPGPVNIATAFERTVGERLQRVVVVGNGAFLSNTFLGNGGNLDLGVNLFNWLAGDDDLIAIQPRPAADSRLDIAPLTLYLIAFSFLLVLPLAFALTGALVWWRRRRV
jgi:ABC-type uncharacterized transport system involved in gliding motility auxiliary subunit